MMMGMAKHHSYNDDHRRNMMVVTRHDCLYYHVIEMDMRTSTLKTFFPERAVQREIGHQQTKKNQESKANESHTYPIIHHYDP